MRDPDFTGDYGRLCSFIVYALTDAQGLAYIGMSSYGLRRPFELEHPARSLLTLSNVKLDVWYYQSEADALAAEAEAIKELKPRCNVGLGGRRGKASRWPRKPTMIA